MAERQHITTAVKMAKAEQSDRRLPLDPCPDCGGDGEVLIEFSFGFQVQDCDSCFGSGTRGTNA